MNKIRFNLFVRKNNFRLIYFVLFVLFIHENSFAQNYWNRDYMSISWNAERNLITISATVYNYSLGQKSENGLLEKCEFEASVDNKNYFKLMEINTPRQNNSKLTTVYFKNKLSNAKIIFAKESITQSTLPVWLHSLSESLTIMIPNSKGISVAGVGWYLDQEFENVRYIRISGKWLTPGICAIHFRKVVYDLKKTKQNSLKPNITDIITKKSQIETINVLNALEAIYIPGTDIGANIKVYSTSGIEMKSFVSENNLIKINRPSKQIYIVHTGTSCYKIAL